MSLLSIAFNGVIITPMRVESPIKNFTTSDVPKGTESVVYKAASLLVHSHKKTLNVGIPSLSQDEEDSLITNKESLFDLECPPDENGENEIVYNPDLDMMEQIVIPVPTTSEIQDKIDSERGFTNKDIERSLEKSGLINTGTEKEPVYSKYISSDDEYVEDGDNWKYNKIRSEIKSELRKKDDTGSEITDLTNTESKNVIIVERKTELATLQVTKLIEDYCEIPSLSTELVSGNCTYVSLTKVITDSSADFITIGVAEDDLVKLNNCLYKVDSVTDATNIILKSGPKSDIIEDIEYKILNSSFMGQFEYTSSE